MAVRPEWEKALVLMKSRLADSLTEVSLGVFLKAQERMSSTVSPMVTVVRLVQSWKA